MDDSGARTFGSPKSTAWSFPCLAAGPACLEAVVGVAPPISPAPQRVECPATADASPDAAIQARFGRRLDKKESGRE